MQLLAKPLRRAFNRNYLKWLRPSEAISRYQQSSIKMKIVEAPAITAISYLRKNEDMKRTLSPHLSIYKPQLTSMMSITLRLTGMALGVITWTVGLTALLSDQNVDYFVNELKSLEVNDFWWTAAKTVVVFPLSFHFVAGVRHLLFDTAKLMEIKQFYGTGYTAIALSCILAVALGMWEHTKDAAAKPEEKN